MKIYIDVTNLMQVDFLTGIQRVVREIVIRFLKDERLEITLLAYSEELGEFELLDRHAFYDFYFCRLGSRENIHTGKKYTIMDMEPGGIFYDMDSVWHSKQKRSSLLPELRNRGLKLAVYIYDIIPIIHPQFVHQNTIVLFMEYLGAYLKYADLIIASTKATLEYIEKLENDMGLEPVPGFVSWLGVDFDNGENDKEKISPNALNAVESGQYVLMIGTIEPRKNHKLVLDAFDHKLFDLGYNLIFAGHFGWDVDELKERILNHPLLGNQLFYVENGNDVTIDYLYRNAYLVAFPSFAEGFGLPVIEALGRGIPVIASNYNVIYEVGKDYAEFFSPQDEEEFIKIFQNYHRHPELYRAWRKKICSYIPFCWEQAEDKIVEALLTLKPSDEKARSGQIRQMVILTARTEDLLNTLPFIEAYMSFIKEIVVCCPDEVAEEIYKGFKGNIRLIFLTDSKVLDGKPLPEDHQYRNFFLRCMLIRQEAIDDVFIMSDDDYRPLYPVSQKAFFDGDRYKGFYFYEMHEWRGCQGALTSFDKGVHRTVKFCDDHRYPTMQFNAHTPQVIEKKVFLEMVRWHEGIEYQGFDEWSMYFNYLMAKYPKKVSFCEYATMNWPGSVTDWTMYCQPRKFMFENYYNYVYSAEGLFAGIKSEYYDGTLEDNKRKMELVLQARVRYNKNRECLESYFERYRRKYGEWPVFCITNISGSVQLYLPKAMELVRRSCNRIDIAVYGVKEWKHRAQTIQFKYYYIDQIGRELANEKIVEGQTNDRFIEIPFVAPYRAGRYHLYCEVRIGEETVRAKTRLKVTD